MGWNGENDNHSSIGINGLLAQEAAKGDPYQAIARSGIMNQCSPPTSYGLNGKSIEINSFQMPNDGMVQAPVQYIEEGKDGKGFSKHVGTFL
jgi:hypothetical protein